MAIHCSKVSVVVLAMVLIMSGRVWADPAVQNNRVISNLVIPVSGTVEGDPETVTLSGRAHITSVLITDPDFGGPRSVLLSVDLLNVNGVGQSTGAKYLVAGEEKMIRLLRPSDLIEITLPILPLNHKGATSTAALNHPALVSFTLKFDVTSGRLTAAKAKLSTSLY